jgi:predicted transcriptional regulator YheO
MTEAESTTIKTRTKGKAPAAPKPARNINTQVKRPGQGLKQSDILAFNHEAEKSFVELISELIQEDGSISYREALREAAFELNISIETAKRYLEKHSARRAEFCVDDGSVRLRVP